jgi:demethoxyubiquinone hydroxylase (CLK1/Coq7/Cat5 family)|tara:strand:+ start:638 stop:904 length:267 start_codon:yes stop_codon:yes gene_type:complete
MTMREKIAEIVFGKLGAAFHGNTGNLLALELADAIIAALPELIPHYEAQQKRIKELESALRSILQIPNSDAAQGIMKAFAEDALGEET